MALFDQKLWVNETDKHVTNIVVFDNGNGLLRQGFKSIVHPFSRMKSVNALVWWLAPLNHIQGSNG
jgi:phosphoglycerate-specific signal transduction histidine kinase